LNHGVLNTVIIAHDENGGTFGTPIRSDSSMFIVLVRGAASIGSDSAHGSSTGGGGVVQGTCGTNGALEFSQTADFFFKLHSSYLMDVESPCHESSLIF